MAAGPGDDVVSGSALGIAMVDGEEGDDRISLGPAGGFADGDEGNDILLGGGILSFLNGGPGTDLCARGDSIRNCEVATPI